MGGAVCDLSMKMKDFLVELLAGTKVDNRWYITIRLCNSTANAIGVDQKSINQYKRGSQSYDLV